MGSQTTFLTPLIALAGWFLGLSIFVQVLQEFYKYLSSSKSRAYASALADFIGGAAVRSIAAKANTVAGPFQFRQSALGKLLPMNEDDLLSALNAALPEWPRRVFDALDTEQHAQNGTAAAPTPAWTQFIRDLEAVKDTAPGASDAMAIRQWLSQWFADLKDPSKLDASALALAFRKQFAPLLEQVDAQFGHFMRNFNYSYTRRNLRQTFIVGFLVAIVLHLPFDAIYTRATAMSPSEAIALANQSQAVYDEVNRTPNAAPPKETPPKEAPPKETTAATAPPAGAPAMPKPNAETSAKGLEIAKEALRVACGQTSDRPNNEASAQPGLTTPSAAPVVPCDHVNFMVDSEVVKAFFQKPFAAEARDVVGWLITALLISFGAPFWNDLVDALTGRDRKQKAAVPEPAADGAAAS